MVSSSKCTLCKNLLRVVRSWSELVSLGWGRSLPRPSSDRAPDETRHSAWKTSGRYSQWWHHTHPGMFLWYFKSRLRLSFPQKGTIPHCFKMLWWPHCEVLLIFMEQVEFWHPSSKYVRRWKKSDLFYIKDNLTYMFFVMIRISQTTVRFLFFFLTKPYLRRRKYKLFACFLEATLVACTDGPVTFEISIGEYISRSMLATSVGSDSVSTKSIIAF